MKYLFILLVITFIGCDTPKESQQKISNAMDSWIGLTKQDVIMQNGMPLKTGSDGAGGEILLYGQQFSFSSPYYHVVWAYKSFFINKEGKVYHWLTQKSPQPPQEIDLNVFIH